MLDTSAVPDVIGLQARNNDAEPTWVLPGRVQNSVRVLIPDDRVASWGFHDATIVDMAGATRPSVSREELSTPIVEVPGVHSGRALRKIASITTIRSTMWVIPSRLGKWFPS